jgi:hypothetical protein
VLAAVTLVKVFLCAQGVTRKRGQRKGAGEDVTAAGEPVAEETSGARSKRPAAEHDPEEAPPRRRVRVTASRKVEKQTAGKEDEAADKLQRADTEAKGVHQTWRAYRILDRAPAWKALPVHAQYISLMYSR